MILLFFCNPDIPEPEAKFIYHHINTERLIAAAGEYNWANLNELRTVGDLWHGIKNAVLHLTEAAVPMMIPTRFKDRCWFTHTHKRLLADKHEAFLLWQEDGTPESLAAWKTARNRLKAETRKS